MKNQNIWTAIVEWDSPELPGDLRYTEEVDVVADSYREAESKVAQTLYRDYEPGWVIRSITPNHYIEIRSI